MGKPFYNELQLLPETYQWAVRQELGPILDAFRPLLGYPLLAIGSGGSLSAAHLAAALHQRRTRNLTSVSTPLEFLSLAQTSAAVLLLSAGGRNPDVLAALWHALNSEPPWTTIVCGSRSSPLGKLAIGNEYCGLFEYAPPAGKDGFLATNSLLATFALLLRIYAAPGEELPESFEELLGVSDLGKFLEHTSTGEIQQLVDRETVVILHGLATKTAAVDLESKLTEAALARVQLADYRNFAHGRHHWLAKRASESAVLALSTPDDQDICLRTLALLPNDIPQLIANFPKTSLATPLQTLVFAFALTEQFGRARKIDPGRPSVPEFGRKLYHLRPQRKRKDTSAHSAPVQRKLRAAHIPPGAADEEFWISCLQTQLATIQKQRFSAIIFDYDGTLCSAERRLKGPTAEMAGQILKLLECGVGVGIATGRGRSVRLDLQKCLAKEHWGSVLIGYYNASDISTLADDTAPCRSETLVESLIPAYETLQADKVLRESCSWTLRPRQITLEPRSWLNGHRLWERANERLQRSNSAGVRAVSSTHSIDVIAPDVSKVSLLDALVSLRQISKDEILCIGDRGKWPGNDHELLTHSFALSADEVSADPLTGWSLAPAGCRGTQATMYYLKHFELKANQFFVRLEEVNS